MTEWATTFLIAGLLECSCGDAMPSLSSNTLSWSALRHLDHDRAWRVLSRLDREGLLILMARALKAVPIEALGSIFSGYAHPHELGHAELPRVTPLLEVVREFREAALRGEFYEDFRVNSHNCTNKSGGTQEFGARLDLLLERCVAEADGPDPTKVCQAYELLFDLLREIDRFERDIVFWADEGGTWNFMVQWERVLPPYYRCLARVARPAEFEKRATSVIDDLVDECDKAAVRRIVHETGRLTPASP